RRPRRKIADPAHGAAAVAGLRVRFARRRRRARGRHLPRAPRKHDEGLARMIAKLTGTVDQVGADGAVIDVGGVGYLAFCSGRTLGLLPGVGQPARLLIETHVREDHIHLYGFIDTVERDWFRLLTTVQGVGARLALAILTAVAADAVSALENLKFGRAEAFGAVSAAARRLGDGAKVEALIAAGLRELSQGVRG